MQYYLAIGSGRADAAGLIRGAGSLFVVRGIFLLEHDFGIRKHRLYSDHAQLTA